MLVAFALTGVRCQSDQWQYSGNAQLTSVELPDVRESNDTAVDPDLPGVLGVHNRKLLDSGKCPTRSANSPNHISIQAHNATSLTFDSMNEVGFMEVDTILCQNLIVLLCMAAEVMSCML